MASRDQKGTVHILCVEADPATRDSRCAMLKFSGYNAFSASPRLAEILLSCQKFDLVVLSTISDFDLNRIANLSDGAQILTIAEATTPQDLLSMVAAKFDATP